MSRERNSHKHRRQQDERWDEPDYQQDEEYEEDEAPRRRRMPQRQPYPHPARSSSSRPVRSSSSPYRAPATRSPNPPSSRTAYTRKLPPEMHQRRVWPFVFMGCAIGIVMTVLTLAIIVMTGIYSLQNGKLSIPVISPTSRTISTEETQTVPLSTISQIVVCDVIGNVVVKADPTASNPTMTITKKVQASSQAAADQEFQRMAVTVQPPQTLTGPLSCARLQATTTPSNTTFLPTQTSNSSSPATTTTDNTSSTLIANVTFPAGPSNASVDLTITIPPNVLPSTGPSAIVNIESAGNISVDGISGVLNIKDDSGNPQNNNDIKVTHAALADGSRLSTAGDITFNGYLAQASDPNKTAFYILEGEKQVDVTLPSNTNVTLDAYAVSGSINSQFSLEQALLQKDKDMTSYHGPLNSSASPPVNAQLTLHVGIGNVNIYQAQTPQT
jgi:hypothetical protein